MDNYRGENTVKGTSRWRKKQMLHAITYEERLSSCRPTTPGRAVLPHMALRLPFPAITSRTRPNLFPNYPPSFSKSRPPLSHSFASLPWRSNSALRWRRGGGTGAFAASCVKQEVEETARAATEWGKVSAVLFDMDGVLCNGERLAQKAGVEFFAEMGIEVDTEEFVPFMGTGEENFLGGVAALKGIEVFDRQAAKKRFYEIYIDKYAKPEAGIVFPGAQELIMQCKSNGLKVAVASSADRVKVNANLEACGFPLSLFDAILSADSFKNLKPAPDIFLAAAKSLNVPTSECVVIEDALVGVQAAKAAQMRCIAVTTTLSDQDLQQAGPSLIRKDIGNISLQDILGGGGSGHHNTVADEKIQGSQHSHSSIQSSALLHDEKTDSWTTQGVKFEGSTVRPSQLGAEKEPNAYELKFQGSRRDILRYGSLGIAVTCLILTVSNWKAMQYGSLSGILNMLFGANQPKLDQMEGFWEGEMYTALLPFFGKIVFVT
ncbi:hypothetical protein ACLOJK_017554 [Asimina triloba]